MSENPPYHTDPPSPPKAFAYLVAGVVFNLLALILLFMGQITAGEIFVGLALFAGLVGIFRGRSATPNTPSRVG